MLRHCTISNGTSMTSLHVSLKIGTLVRKSSPSLPYHINHAAMRHTHARGAGRMRRAVEHVYLL